MPGPAAPGPSYGVRSDLTRYGVKAKAGALPGCPVVAEDLEQDQERFYVTRQELISLVDEAMKKKDVGC